MKSSDARRSARRVSFARVILLLTFAVLSVRAGQLAMFDHRAVAQGDAQTSRILTLPPERGAVLDRSGATLALSIDAPSVYVEPQRIQDPATTARELARIFGLDRNTLRKRLEQRGPFRFVARWVEPDDADRVRDLNIIGVGIVHEPKRVYPHKTLAAPLVGFANIDGRGVRGIEQQEDSWLRGTTRRLPMERDGAGRRMLVSDTTTWGTSGGDIALTLDAAMQSAAERALSDSIAATGARGGIVVSMNPMTGEIYSIAEAPGFDPNHFRTLDYDSTRSAAFLDAVEPGSVFKTFLVAAALEAGTLRSNSLIDSGDGTLQVPGKLIRDTKPYGWISASDMLRVSSNVGAVKIAQDLGGKDHHEMLERFGFGQTTGSRFPDESSGLIRSWREWRPLDHATIAFGQGVSVTPIQLATATAALANGGNWVRPRLVAARRVAGGRWQATTRESLHRVIAPDIAAQVLGMMERVVAPDGTGRLAAISGIRIAGKTGTAQKWDTQAGTYSQEAFRSWFVGVAPVEDPRLVVVVSLDEPKRPLHTGGASAAPLFAQIVAEQLPRLGILPAPAPKTLHVQTPHEAPSNAEANVPVVTRAEKPHEAPRPTRVAEASEPSARSTIASAQTSLPPVAAAPPEAKPTPAIPKPTVPTFDRLHDRVLLPDLSGLTPAQVTLITDAGSLRVTFQGAGRAIRQDPPPGTVVPAGGLVSVELDGDLRSESPTALVAEGNS